MTFINYQIPLAFLSGFLTSWCIFKIFELTSTKEHDRLADLLEDANKNLAEKIRLKILELNEQQNEEKNAASNLHAAND